jgi:NTP pyrophosphatase (non-canonical NTP hydrolase)
MIEDPLDQPPQEVSAEILDQYELMVTTKKKNPELILDELTALDMDLIHMGLGIGSEAGELLTAVKKSTMYNKPLDHRNVLEELGDLLFYIQGMLLTLQRYYPGVNIKDIMLQNIDKLNKRYKKGFTNEEAGLRLDKAGEE